MDDTVIMCFLIQTLYMLVLTQHESFSPYTALILFARVLLFSYSISASPRNCPSLNHACTMWCSLSLRLLPTHTACVMACIHKALMTWHSAAAAAAHVLSHDRRRVPHCTLFTLYEHSPVPYV
jgi:hypothetical protein